MYDILVGRPQETPIRLPIASTVRTAIEALYPEVSAPDVIAASLNGQIASLNSPLLFSAQVIPVLANSQEARQIQRRSLCFAVAAASYQVFPERELTIGHSLGDGYYFHFKDLVLEETDLIPLNKTLRQICEQDEEIRYLRLSWQECIQALEALGRSDTVALLRQHNDEVLDLHGLGNWLDIDHGALVARTSQLPEWTIRMHGDGFVISHPGEPEPDLLQPFRNSKLIFSIYQEYKRWGHVLDISSVAQLNDLAGDKKVKNFIWTAEALHQQKLTELTAKITEAAGRVQTILIAGPSSSGKTTFAKKLSIQMSVAGLKPLAISLDDYFVNRVNTPLDENGNYDFEHLNALDIAFLNEQLLSLLEGKEIEVPSFDFKRGERIFAGKTIMLPPGGIIVMEGIHGLNDALTPLIAHDRKFKIYVSALTQLNIDSLNRIPTTDNRLLRRMVRDSRYRGHSAENTLLMWPNVRRGENKNIFPFQDLADGAFNSALDYELGVLKPYAEPLLKSVRPDSTVYAEARRLLRFLDAFLPIPAEYVPENSILREFIGGSVFKY